MGFVLAPEIVDHCLCQSQVKESNPSLQVPSPSHNFLSVSLCYNMRGLMPTHWKMGAADGESPTSWGGVSFPAL